MIFVLVHGAFQGGWCWKRVRKLLADGGHEVFTPSLTGLGEHSHLLSADIGLETHVRDVVNLLTFEDLRDVVLVGHSYGGTVVTGVCELAGSRVRRLVYLDALIPSDGQNNFDLLDKSVADLFRQTAMDGWCVEVPPDMLLPYLGINSPEDCAWFEQRLKPQSLRTFEQTFRCSTGALEATPKTFIQCTNPSSGSAYERAAAQTQTENWAYFSLPTAHEPMWTMPRELADILLQVARSDPLISQPELLRTSPTWTS